MRLLLIASLGVFVALGFSGCGCRDQDSRHQMIVSVRDQRMLLVRDGKPIKSYKVSTSKFGIGDRPGSNCTPLGRMEVRRKIGDKVPAGTVFKHRSPTGEVIRPDAPGRDPIVSRILWLRGTEPANRHAYGRFIYIHGTAEERRLGSPASYGCIRMGGRDVIDLYNRVGLGADVFVIRSSLTSTPAKATYAGLATPKSAPKNAS
jgi:lipoprotein-anchoring transpeptidase ErfK/SrfK